MQLMTLTMIRGVHVDEDEIETEITVPVTVNAEHIRSFCPRQDGKPGTRLTFVGRGGFAVTEDYETVEACLRAC
jgi:hypothetical protein